MEEESDKRAGGRRAPARLHRQTSDQREKPEKKGAVYGEILFVHQQRLATPLVISNLWFALHLSAVLPWRSRFLPKTADLITY